MRYTHVATSAIALVVAGNVLTAQSRNTTTLDAVARAMGGKDRVLAIRTIVEEGMGDVFNVGQNLTPTAELPRFEVTQARRSLDFVNRRWFLDQTRVPRFTTGNVAPQRQRIGFDVDVAYNVGNNDVMQRVGGQVAVDRANELLYHPIGFLQAAYGPNTEVFDDDVGGGIRRIRINPGGNKIEMFVDTRTMLPLRTQKHTYHPMLGDVLLELAVADWQDVDGLRLPTRHTWRLDERWVTADIRLSSRVNADVGNIAASPELRAQPAPALAAMQSPPPSVNVTVEEIVPGVWYLAGQSHHSVAIEQSKSIVLVEAPQNDARTLAVIAKARELSAAKPVDAVINTHHHFDHAGGVRAAISEGLTIITHEGNRDFYERTVYPRRHFIMQDALARNPKPLRLIQVGDKSVRSDSLRTIEVYQITGSQHSGSMVMVYLPAERLLIEADLYSPPPASATTMPAFPFAANLLENIQRRGLQVDRIVPIHGRVVPFGDLQAAARQP